MRTPLIALFLLPLWAYAQPHPLSLSEAFSIAEAHNSTIAIAREGIATAKAEAREINSLWYPTITLSAEYSHSLSEVAAVTTIGEIGGEVLNGLESTLATNPPLAALVEGVAASPITLPLIPRNTAEVGVEIAWVVFSGGRRMQSAKISEAVKVLANQRLSASRDAVGCAVVESYFALCLAERIVEVRGQEVASLAEHLRQARSLEREGMIVPAERLTAEVAWEQSKAEFEAAQSNSMVANSALTTLLGCDTSAITATTPLFIPDTLPSKEFLFSQIAYSPTLQSIEHQEEIASLSLASERGRYLPSVALLGHQQLWSVGLNKHLFPRTIVGVGLSWTLFDGLMREGAIARAKSLVRTTNTTHKKVGNEMHLAIEKFYSELTTALDEYRVGTHTIALARELLRSRERAFAEGMATSSEVVDARLLLSQIEVANLTNLYRADCALGNLLMLTGCMDNYLSYTPQ